MSKFSVKQRFKVSLFRNPSKTVAASVIGFNGSPRSGDLCGREFFLAYLKRQREIRTHEEYKVIVNQLRIDRNYYLGLIKKLRPSSFCRSRKNDYNVYL